YAYVLALISLISIPSEFGLPNLLMRETAKTYANRNWGLMRGLWRWATFIIGVVAFFLLAFSFMGSAFLGDKLTDEQKSVFGLALVSVPFTAWGSLRGAAMRGLGHPVMGQIPESLVRPGALILAFAAAYYLGLEMSPSVAM